MNMMYTINASLFVAVVSTNAASFFKQSGAIREYGDDKNRSQLLKVHTFIIYSIISVGIK